MQVGTSFVHLCHLTFLNLWPCRFTIRYLWRQHISEEKGYWPTLDYSSSPEILFDNHQRFTLPSPCPNWNLTFQKTTLWIARNSGYVHWAELAELLGDIKVSQWCQPPLPLLSHILAMNTPVIALSWPTKTSLLGVLQMAAFLTLHFYAKHYL